MPICPLPLCWRRLVYLWLSDPSAQPKRQWPAIPLAVAPVPARIRNFRGAEGKKKGLNNKHVLCQLTITPLILISMWAHCCEMTPLTSAVSSSTALYVTVSGLSAGMLSAPLFI